MKRLEETQEVFGPRAQRTGGRLWGLSRRGWLFMILLALSATGGLGFTFARAPVYRSSATLLVEPARNRADSLRSQDDQNGFLSAPPDNLQALATERQRFLSPVVVAQVAQQFTAELRALGAELSPEAGLQAMLNVEYDAATNLIQVGLDGANPALQQRLLVAWLAAYEVARTVSNTTTHSTTGAGLQLELQQLEARIATQRSALDAYRERHGIVSSDRTENREAAKLRGLNDSLNTAEEEELKATAYLAAVTRAIELGEPVTQDRDRAALERLTERIAVLRDQVRANADRYTDKFAQIAPEIMDSQKALAQAERDLAAQQETATREVRSQAQTQLASVRSHKASLLVEQAALRGALTRFAQHFEAFTLQQEQLLDLEAQAKPLRERLVQTEVAGAELLPTVSVLSPPDLPLQSSRPDYGRDAAISVAGAFAFALLGVWLTEFLSRRALAEPSANEAPPVVYAANPPTVWPVLSPPAPNAYAQAAPGTLALPPAAAGLPRELLPAEVRALLATADDPTKLMIAMLMSGVDGVELGQFEWANARADGVLQVGMPPREVRLNAPYAALLGRLAQEDAASGGVVVPGLTRARDPTELSAVLLYLAHDAGLAHPEEITLEALRHTYFAFLVRQGLKLGELPRLGGPLAPGVLASYARYSPPGVALALEEVPLDYPGLTAAA
ncbi:MAG: hypothetical protein EXR83_02345 [Gammaproteobacteria bacterium]|nr:hypothetical protein [Gammaproteobacteria bacterium]